MIVFTVLMGSTRSLYKSISPQPVFKAVLHRMIYLGTNYWDLKNCKFNRQISMGDLLPLRFKTHNQDYHFRPPFFNMASNNNFFFNGIPYMFSLD